MGQRETQVLDFIASLEEQAINQDKIVAEKIDILVKVLQAFKVDKLYSFSYMPLLVEQAIESLEKEMRRKRSILDKLDGVKIIARDLFIIS